MTDQEKITKLAEKVMGWEWKPYEFGLAPCYHKDGKPMRFDFDPFTNPADNDALIEAFVGKFEPLCFDVCVGYAEVGILTEESGWIYTDWNHPYTTAKKNRAVAEAIYEAVTS